MIKIRLDKSLEEVWKWKEEIYNEIKYMIMEKRVKKIKADASKIVQEYGSDLKIVSK